MVITQQEWTKNAPSGEIKLQFYVTNMYLLYVLNKLLVGHINDLGGMRLSKYERDEVAILYYSYLSTY